jgi:diguanylate cyclase (GGDEF)-like protein
VRRLDVQHGNKALGPFSVSIGVATYPVDSDTADGLLKEADNALYQAKEEGRDRLVMAGARRAGNGPAAKPENI